MVTRGNIVLSKLSPTNVYVHGHVVGEKRLLSDAELDTTDSFTVVSSSSAPERGLITHL